MFRSEFAEGEDADVFLCLSRPNARGSNPTVFVDCGKGETEIILTIHPTFYRFPAKALGGGKINIRLLARGRFLNNELRGLPIFIGWCAVAYCRSNNHGELMETLSNLIPSALSSQ